MCQQWECLLQPKHTKNIVCYQYWLQECLLCSRSHTEVIYVLFTNSISVLRTKAISVSHQGTAGFPQNVVDARDFLIDWRIPELYYWEITKWSNKTWKQSKHDFMHNAWLTICFLVDAHKEAISTKQGRAKCGIIRNVRKWHPTLLQKWCPFKWKFRNVHNVHISNHLQEYQNFRWAFKILKLWSLSLKR